MYTFSLVKGEAVAIIKNGRLRSDVLRIVEQPENDGSIPPASIYNHDHSIRKVKPRQLDTSGRVIKIAKGTLEPVPSMNKRDVMYVSGPSGVGKSVFCAMYAENFVRMWPEKKVYLFSRLEQDSSIDSVKNLVRIPLTVDNLTLLDSKSFSDSLVIFDDCDTISAIKLKKAVDKLKDDIMQVGRHHKIYIIITSHLLNRSRETRIIMQEMNKLVIFPHSGSRHFLNYCFQKYVGLDRSECKSIFNLSTRWAIIHTHMPRYVLYETGAYLL